MNAEEITKYVKAGVAILGVAGIRVAPDDAETIGAALLAIYAIITAIQGRFFKRDKKLSPNK